MPKMTAPALDEHLDIVNTWDLLKLATELGDPCAVAVTYVAGGGAFVSSGWIAQRANFQIGRPGDSQDQRVGGHRLFPLYESKNDKTQAVLDAMTWLSTRYAREIDPGDHFVWLAGRYVGGWYLASTLTLLQRELERRTGKRWVI